MTLTPFTSIGASFTSVGYQAMRDWCTYTLKAKGVRAWHNSLLGSKEVWVGIDLAAGENASGDFVAIENFARVVDLNTTGLNGWDGTGSISADQIVYLWLVAKDSDDLLVADNFGFIGSASYNSPTLPSGFTHKALVSVCHTETDGGTWKVSPFRHKEDRYEYSTSQLVATYSSSRSAASQSLGSCIPVPPYSIIADIEVVASSTSGLVTGAASCVGATNPMYDVKAYSGKNDEAAGPIYCDSRNIVTEASIATTGTVSIYVSGFWWPYRTYNSGRADLSGLSMLGIGDSLTAAHLNGIRDWISQPIAVENILIKNSDYLPDENIEVYCDRITLWNPSDNTWILAENCDLNCYITAPGIGGLDTGSVAANQYYYIYVIGKDTDNDLVADTGGTGVGPLLSLSATSPTMPTGYTHRRLVGVVRTDASSDLLPMIQVNNIIVYGERQSITSTTSNVTLQALNLSSRVPPQSEVAMISAVNDVATPSGQCDIQLHVTTALAKYVGMDADYYEQSQVSYWMPAPGQAIAYAVQQVASYGTVTIYCIGFIWPLEGF